MEYRVRTIGDVDLVASQVKAKFHATTRPFTVEIKDGVRTLSQNALFHRWVGEIAEQTNESADQVKRECKFYIGVPILMSADPDFVAFVSNLKSLTTEEKIAAMDFIAVTSIMTTGQLSQMCDAVFRKYTEQGVRLTIPEEKK